MVTNELRSGWDVLIASPFDLNGDRRLLEVLQDLHFGHAIEPTDSRALPAEGGLMQ